MHEGLQRFPVHHVPRPHFRRTGQFQFISARNELVETADHYPVPAGEVRSDIDRIGDPGRIVVRHVGIIPGVIDKASTGRRRLEDLLNDFLAIVVLQVARVYPVPGRIVGVQEHAAVRLKKDEVHLPGYSPDPFGADVTQKPGGFIHGVYGSQVINETSYKGSKRLTVYNFIGGGEIGCVDHHDRGCGQVVPFIVGLDLDGLDVFIDSVIDHVEGKRRGSRRGVPRNDDFEGSFRGVVIACRRARER